MLSKAIAMFTRIILYIHYSLNSLTWLTIQRRIQRYAKQPC